METISLIGPVTALSLLKKHGSIEALLPTLDRKKNPVPSKFPFEEVRQWFQGPPCPSDVIDPSAVDLSFRSADTNRLRTFLENKNVKSASIDRHIARLEKATGNSSASSVSNVPGSKPSGQMSLLSFFGKAASTAGSKSVGSSSNSKKRPAENDCGAANGKKVK
jgi:flap endonuclease-1